MCMENAVPENLTNVGESLIEVERNGELSTENAVPVDTIKIKDGNDLIAMAAEMMKRNLTKQGIFVPALNSKM